MFETLFGAELPLAVRFFIAFLVVLGLIALTAWVVRRFGADRLGGGSTRGRVPRLAVIDAASVDSRRRLVIIRRDNVEHLLMIGGPNDVVVESNIVRAIGAQRDVSRATGDALPRAVPLGDAWPLQPEPSVPAAAPQASAPPARENQWHPPEHAPVTRPSPRSADTIAGLAAELSSGAAHTAPPSPQPPAAPSEGLTEMAQRLEQALRRPGSSVPSAGESVSKADAHPPASAQSAPAQQQGKSKSMYDSLEQEMASLLGRPKK